MAEKNELNGLEGINLEPDTPDHELVVDNSEDDYYSVDNDNLSSDDTVSAPKEKEESDISDYALDDDELSSDKSVQKKRTKLQKILTVVLTVLVVLLTIGVILYFVGFFDEEEKPAPKPMIKKEKVQEKGFDFKTRDINTQRLNKKLNNLNKYDDEILKRKKEEEAKQKALEEEKRKAMEEQKRKEAFEKVQLQIEDQKNMLEKEQQALESQKEELVMLKDKLLSEVEEKKAELSKLMEEKDSLTQPENMMNEKMPNEGMMSEKQMDDSQMMNETKTANSFLSFINVAVLKKDLKKSFLQKIERIDNNIYLCRDNKNNIEIYVGPFEMSDHRNETLNKFLSSGFREAMQIDLTTEEFNKRCKY